MEKSLTSEKDCNVMKRYLLTLIITGMAYGLNAQNEANRWYFGINAGISFTNGIPNASQGALNSTEGTTASCDSLGNFNFYSDGVTVWNRYDSIMPNGTGS